MDINIYDYIDEIPEFLQHEDLISFDLETTGVNSSLDVIIELGAIEFKNGKIIKEYDEMYGGGTSPVFLVRQIHGIRDCERIGKATFKERSDEIIEWFNGKTLVGHNIKNFDIPMIQQKLHEIGKQLVNVKVIDTLTLARKSKLFESNTLQSLCKYFDLPYGNHRGLFDSVSTLLLLFKLIKKMNLEKI